MISREDCLALCGLSIDEILALAEHEHVPTMLAAGLGAHLLCQKDGCRTIRQMIIDDIADALARGDTRRVSELKRTLKTFLADHPVPGTAASGASPRSRPRSHLHHQPSRQLLGINLK